MMPSFVTAPRGQKGPRHGTPLYCRPLPPIEGRSHGTAPAGKHLPISTLLMLADRGGESIVSRRAGNLLFDSVAARKRLNGLHIRQNRPRNVLRTN